MRVLVTGAKGFTGQYLCAELGRRKHEIIEFDADITDSEAVVAAVAAAKPEAVIHLAAIAFVAAGDAAPFYQVNQLGTFHLLDAVAAAAPDARILLVSSANIYGNRTEGLLDEGSLPDPVNHYGVSKWATELGARLWADRLFMTVVRPFNYTGIGQDEQYLVPKIIAHFKRKDEIIELGNLDVKRDFGDVRSVVSAYCDLIATPAAIGQTYNVSTGQTHSLQDIIAIVSSLSGHRIKVRVNPAFVRANDVKILAGNPAKLCAILPEWAPRPVEDTLAWMLGGRC
jgi:nucleoside-diphosphate-sugar epimerase